MNRYTIGIFVAIVLVAIASSMDQLLFSQIAVGVILLAVLAFVARRYVRKHLATGSKVNKMPPDREQVRR
jgi:hypothetical protein